MEAKTRKIKRPLRYRYSALVKRFNHEYVKRDKLFVLVDQYFGPGNILDIGCSDGGVLSRLTQKHIPFGIEISSQLAEKAHHYAQSRGGMVFNGNAIDGLGFFKKGFFEGVIMSSYLEHEIHPTQVLKNTLRMLKPGGALIIKVPNFNSINRV
ncbi:MAG: methyltransferase domain-containing protein, partial [Candidatus Aminicenantes bacterium]|nr:methyltransferase domain-containing protein [Candidatus Aminicenantes bacterium]NIR06546.1 methyltransferase domain-containing protein [Candidatus Aminicenantes bacterium]